MYHLKIETILPMLHFKRQRNPLPLQMNTQMSLQSLCLLQKIMTVMYMLNCNEHPFLTYITVLVIHFFKTISNAYSVSNIHRVQANSVVSLFSQQYYGIKYNPYTISCEETFLAEELHNATWQHASYCSKVCVARVWGCSIAEPVCTVPTSTRKQY